MKTRARESAQQVNKGPASDLAKPKQLATGIVDNRASTFQERQQIEGIQTSPQAMLQRKQMEKTFGTAFRGAMEEDEELLQGRPDKTRGKADVAEQSKNKTGLPDRLKLGIEQLSGVDMSAVRVHRNSDKPAQLDALAYTRGNDIYLGSGQEQHLPHEAWHVVQQAQGRVKPTRRVSGENVNDDASLEKEAEQMGAEALVRARAPDSSQAQRYRSSAGNSESVGQRIVQLNGKPTITHSTTSTAPDGSPDTRTKVGVGEEVIFNGSAAGKWSTTGGTAGPPGNSNTFTWTAPDRVAAAAIRLSVGGKDRSVWMNVIEPASITATKNSEIAIPPGTAGAGMRLTFNYHPKTVSFGNVEAREVSGPATNITGYYDKHYSENNLKHDSGDTFYPINADNTDSAEDTASTTDPHTPYENGTFDWVIPNRFKVKTEGGDGKEFTKVTQAFTIDATGKVKVTKAGAEVERSP